MSTHASSRSTALKRSEYVLSQVYYQVVQLMAFIYRIESKIAAEDETRGCGSATVAKSG